MTDGSSCVVFDLDGTLIESEQVWRDVRHEFVNAHGGRWHDNAQSTMIGMRTQEWARYIHDEWLCDPGTERGLHWRGLVLKSSTI